MYMREPSFVVVQEVLGRAIESESSPELELWLGLLRENYTAGAEVL